MNYFIIKNGDELDTLEGIVEHMKTPMKIFRSKDEKPKADMVIRWGCTANLYGNPKVFNKAKAIHNVYDKSSFRSLLQAENLCPETTFSSSLDDMDSVGYPCIVRPRHHARAENFYVCKTYPEVSNAVKKCGNGYYISTFINTKDEYRVFIVQGRVVSVMLKPPAYQGQIVRNNKEAYVRFSEWPIPIITAALQAYNISGLDFTAADLITDRYNRPYVLELNTAPEIVAPYRQECMAKAFDWMFKNGRDTIKPKGQDWKAFIHPAISEHARV